MSKRDKPLGATLGWKRLATRYPFVTQWLRLRQDRVRIEDKGDFTFTYREAPDAVAVVPVTRDRKIVLVRQYRYTVDDWCLEVPAGGTHDRTGIPLEEVALEELHEEIGATCERARLIPVAVTYTVNAISDEKLHLFLALDVELVARPQPEDTELLSVEAMPVAEALDMARLGKIKDSQSALSILLCEDLLRQYGYL
ncbi:MAG TPA: NUDIX hydrolase [Chloroflexia bacterium]|nr:NUDIX hydrolase [Chloroflexia bacterium]